MKTKRWYYLLPVVGVMFGLWYVKAAFVDVVYSDYIRLVNSYLPDVWNPDKFLVGDILTRMPLNYAARIINVTFFDYRIRFDQVLGVISLGISAGLILSYCIRKEIGGGWTLCLMIVLFSLNKWEMMINGSGWIHFLAFAGFYYHYLVLERIWNGEEKQGDRKRLLILPWVVTLTVAGPYCAIYTVVLLLAYGFRIIRTRLQRRQWEREFFLYGISAMIPLLLYMWSNSKVEPEPLGVAQVPLMTQLLDTPGFFVRFFIKSFSSMVIGVETAQARFSSNGPYLILGLLVLAAYGLALWQQYWHRLYEKTIFPLILIAAGGMNHLLIMVSRWVFLREDYGMSSRYALQFQVGIIGVLLTFGLVWKSQKEKHTENGAEDHKKIKAGAKARRKIQASRGIMAAMAAVVLAGNLYTTADELRKAPDRRNACAARAALALDFENRTDEELKANFEYHMSRPEGGQEVRAALKILKENQWNIFRQQK